ncbi:SAV_2336 N-terminal domain-related protein, partial [Streptomyces sp. NPDC023723]|uniref:SAV_2336 N-terminal domain-related protein n=1 Tax=Streptomyces sp. NPDC023723 TaxID=3154323 RepID=UPI0033EC1D4B
MPSDPSGAPEPVARLADVLARAAGGARPTPLELAELLWLAQHLAPGDPAAPAPAPPSDRPPDTPVPGPAPRPPVPDPRRAADPEPPPPAPPVPPAPRRAPLRLPARTPDAEPGTAAAEPHAALLVPAPPMLPHPLALQRSLRPLRRRTDAPAVREVDEAATADRIARLGADPRWWLPVLKPARERWLRLHLVHDDGPTMPVWRPLVRELHTVLAQSGVFRTVTLHRARPDGTVAGDGVHAPADGRTVTLLISDCMGPQWRAGPAGERWFAALRRWARRMPLAVVQPLPEHLWRDTALPPVPGRLSAPYRAAPSAALAFTPYDTAEEAPPEGAVPVPVLEPGPEWLANWAALVAGPGGSGYPGSAAALLRPLPADADDRTDLARLPAEELVLRFRATASPAAYRLAGHLALGRPDLPVMRLVQAAVEPEPRPAHLAEVILSGLLAAVPGPPGAYVWRPGVRDLLLRGLPRTARARTRELLLRTGDLIEERAARFPGEIAALTPAPDGTESGPRGEAIAEISERGARRLTGVARAPGPASAPAPRLVAGRYRLVRRLRPDGTVWLAKDTGPDGRTVAVRLHARTTDPARRQAFLRDARLLRTVDHPGVVRVLDTGVDDDTPYVVMEHLDGIALNTLSRPYGHRLPAPLTVSVAAQLARALTALHEAGTAHGAVELSRVVLLPDGTVQLTGFAAGRGARPGARAEDLRALCELLLLLASGSARLTLPVDSGRLGHLPPDLRGPFAHALDLLMSPSLQAQRQGRDLLTDPVLPRLARQAYEQRFYYALGPLRVERPEGAAELPPDAAALLAVLLLKHGRTVTHEELRYGLWDPADQPRDGRRRVRLAVERLTRALGPGVLATPSHGYALHTSADFVDVVHCEELVRRADAAQAAGADTEARELVAEALALWRSGDPLPDVPGPSAHTARGHLQQLRLALHARLAGLDLALGDADRAARSLADLLATHPLHETFLRLYLLALRRLGRLDEALDAYEEYELSGGGNPELLALGRELRQDHAVPADVPSAYQEPGPDGSPHTAVAAPDELPEGPFPTEDGLWTPLLTEGAADAATESESEDSDSEESEESETAPETPVGFPPFDPERREDEQDEPEPEPETEFEPEPEPEFEPVRWFPPQDEPQYEPQDEPEYETAHRVCVRYALAEGPRGAEAHAALTALVTELLADSALAADAHRLPPAGPGAVLVRLEPRVPAGALLRATVDRLPGRLARLGGLRLRAEFWQVESGPDGGAEQIFRADPETVTAALDAAGAQAVVAVSDALYYDEVADEGLAFPPRAFQRLADGTGWYHLVPGTARTAPAGHPVRGPFPLPADGWVPPPRDASEAVVLLLPDGTPLRPDAARVRTASAAERAGWRYCEVDLRPRHLVVDAAAGVAATWRVADPVR